MNIHEISATNKLINQMYTSDSKIRKPFAVTSVHLIR